MKFIVKNEKEKNEFLRTCQYIHDFSVMFRNASKKVKIDIINSFDGSIKNERLDYKRERACGISLDFEQFPILNLLAGIHDCEEDVKEEILNKFIIVDDNEEELWDVRNDIKNQLKSNIYSLI